MTASGALTCECFWASSIRPGRVVARPPLCDAYWVPLSEDEERILSEMEERLSETDPRLVREVSETTLYTQPLRSMKWAVGGFVTGVALMVATLSTSYLLALRLERNARQVGRTGLRQVASSGRTSSLRDVVGGTRARARDRMRDRFGRGEGGRI